jgi:hypothetical protein
MENTLASSQPFAFASPGQPGYRSSVPVFNLAIEQEPSWAATATTTEEVARAVAFAREQGLRLRIVSTGHGSDTANPVSGEALLHVCLDDPVTVDPKAVTARIPAGATWGDVAIAAAPFDLAALHGSSPLVGAIGYLLGGGMSFYGREYGVASNLVVSIEILFADGSRTTTDHDHDPDLFDALRGGKKTLGVIVALTTKLIRVGSVHTGAAFWPVSEAPFLLRTWNDWTKTAPRGASTSFRMMNLPPLPGIPPQLSGGPVICIAGAVLDSPKSRAADVAAELLGPLRSHSTPLLDTWHEGPPADVLVMHMDPSEPMPYLSDHQMLGELEPDSEAALLSVLATKRSSRVTFIELRQLGGAMAESDPRGGAINSYGAAVALYSLAALFAPDAREAAEEQLADLRQTMSPWDLGFTAANMVASPTELGKALDSATANRVDGVRRRVDPNGLFV